MTHQKMTFQYAVAVVLLAIAVSGCAEPGDRTQGSTPAYTPKQAIAIAERLPAEAAATMTPRPKLEFIPAGFCRAPCAGPADTDDTGLVMYERTYWLNGIKPEGNQQLREQLKAFWAAHGFIVALDMDSTKTTGTWAIAAENKTTGFQMRLVQGMGGKLSLSAQSPCTPDDGGGRLRPRRWCTTCLVTGVSCK